MSYNGPIPYGQVRVALKHPLADEVSIIWGFGTYTSGIENREIAFFKNDEWVTTVIPEFAEYADGSIETMVYGWVPVTEVVSFLEQYILSCERYPMVPSIGP